MRSLILLSALLLGLIGCSPSAPPPPQPPAQADIENGVNWALSQIISWKYKDKNLFDAYKLTNQYTEKKDDGTAFVYDFQADCLVQQVYYPDYDSGNGGKNGWVQALTNAGPAYVNSQDGGDLRSFTGSFTVIKKGDVWYVGKTVR